MISKSGIEFPDGPSVDADPYGAWMNLADTLQGALDDPDVADRKFDVGPPGQMTVEQAIGMIVVGDVLIHTCNLATATGLDDRLDPTIVTEMLIGMQQIDEMLRHGDSCRHFASFPSIDTSPSAPVASSASLRSGCPMR